MSGACGQRELSRRRFMQGAGVAGLGLLAGCGILPPQAQQPKQVPRIGYLSSSDPATDSTRVEAIRLALRELGYIDGQNIATEYRYAEWKLDRAPGLAAELARLKVDLIVAVGGSRLIRAAQDATKTIPIVMMGGLDPVKAGIVESLARPGGNVTGLTLLSTELGGKRLELLKEAVPQLARVGVLYDPAAPGNVPEVQEDLPVAARALGLTVRSWEVRDADDFERVFAALNKERPDGLYVPAGGPLMFANGNRIASFALKSRLPSMYNDREAVDAGGLMSYEADLAAAYRRVAYYVDKILKGAQPADLPIERPMRFDFVINLKTAQALGLTIPHHVLLQATEVIQ
jgi:putative tryptophan/tyrosine transport system substrate-binding protein